MGAFRIHCCITLNLSERCFRTDIPSLPMIDFTLQEEVVRDAKLHRRRFRR
jgi:hypothetical protein